MSAAGNSPGLTAGGARYISQRQAFPETGKPCLLQRLLGYTLSRCEMTTARRQAYIVSDDQILGGQPMIRGMRTPVRAIVETWRLGVAAEDPQLLASFESRTGLRWLELLQ